MSDLLKFMSSPSNYSWDPDNYVVSNVLASPPSLVVFQDRLFCFYELGALTSDGLEKNYQSTGYVGAWVKDGDSDWNATDLTSFEGQSRGLSLMTSGPVSLVVYNDLLYCIREGPGNAGSLFCGVADSGYGWRSDTDLKLGTSGRPGLAVFNDKLYCIREGPGNCGRLFCAVFDGNTWTDSDTGLETSGPPSLIVFNNILYCIREGAGNEGWVHCAAFDGRWLGDRLLHDMDSTLGTTGTPAVAPVYGGVVCLREGDDNSGWIWGSFSQDIVNWSLDALLPSADNAYGTSGPPALATWRDVVYCCHRSRGGNDLWYSTFSPKS